MRDRATSYNNNKLHDDRLLFKKWATNTPHDFRFTIKLSKQIIEDTYKVMEEVAPLEEKMQEVQSYLYPV